MTRFRKTPDENFNCDAVGGAAIVLVNNWYKVQAISSSFKMPIFLQPVQLSRKLNIV